MKRTEYRAVASNIAKLIIGIALGSLAVAAAFFGVATMGVNAAFPNWDGADWIRNEAVRIGGDSPDKEVALADLAGHPVTTACWISEYVDLLPVTEGYGLPVDGISDVEVRENSLGLFMANAETVSYGEFRLHDVDQDAVYATKCTSGSDLALVFDSIAPLAGGRLVDRRAMAE